MIFCLVLVAALTVHEGWSHTIVKRDVKVVNDIVDELLAEAKSEMIAAGETEFAIPDMHENFQKRWHFINVKGDFTATGGVFRNLATLHRTGDVTFTTTDTSMSFAVNLGLQDMEVEFNHYKARFEHIGPSGHLKVKVKKNSLNAQVSLTLEGDTCKAVLDHATLDKFEDIDIHITGLGPLNWIFGKIATWVTKHYNSKIKSKVQSKLYDALTKAMAKRDLCKMIPH